jgi:hypothetical protein
MWDDFAISEKLFKANNRPMGENSPNLVTLFKIKVNENWNS